MKARIVKIGNSRGVRVPKTLLDEVGLTADSDVELTVVDGEIRIVPVEPDSGATFLLLSRDALSDWDRPEEDEAWAHLQ